jgi:hypothetical protein
MNGSSGKIFVLIAAVLATAVAVSGFFYGQRKTRMPLQKVAASSCAKMNAEETAAVKLFASPRLHVAFEYPATFADVEERDNSIVLKTDADSPWDVEVTAVPTAAASAKEWLAAQGVHAGYVAIAWIGDDAVLVTKRDVVDASGATKIYGKSVQGLRVENGTLYAVAYRNEVGEGDVPVVDAGFLEVVAGLRAE